MVNSYKIYLVQCYLIKQVGCQLLLVTDVVLLLGESGFVCVEEVAGSMVCQGLEDCPCQDGYQASYDEPEQHEACFCQCW